MIRKKTVAIFLSLLFCALYADQDLQEDKVRSSREDAPAAIVNDAIVAACGCDLTPILSMLKSIKKRIANLQELMCQEFKQTWVMLSDIDQEVFTTQTVLSEKFDETWTILDNIDVDFFDCCTTLEGRFDETWTILFDIDQDIFSTQTISCDKFEQTWTVLAGIDIDLNDCCTTLEGRFDETWTVLVDIDQDIVATQTVLCNKFEQTWTILAAIDADLTECCTSLDDFFDETWTVLVDIQQDIFVTRTILCDRFDETWTVLQDIAECCQNIVADPCNTTTPISGPTTISSPGTYCLTKDISRAGDIITINTDNVVFDLNEKTISGGTNGIKVANQTDIIIKNGIVKLATSNGILVDTCENVDIVGLDFIANNNGLYVQTTTSVLVEHSTFREHTGSDVSTEGALVLDASNDCLVRNNKVIDNKTGNFGNNGILLINSSINNQISENTCNGNGLGIHLRSSNFNTISGNTCNENTGFLLNLFPLIILEGSIELIESMENVIAGNICQGNLIGIELRDASSENLLVRNTCTTNNNDIVVRIGSSNNTVTRNTCHNSLAKDGIRVSSDTNYITFNQCNENTRYGINDAGTGNKVYNNSAIDNGMANYTGGIPVQRTPGVSPLQAGSNFSG